MREKLTIFSYAENIVGNGGSLVHWLSEDTVKFAVNVEV